MVVWTRHLQQLRSRRLDGMGAPAYPRWFVQFAAWLVGLYTDYVVRARRFLPALQKTARLVLGKFAVHNPLYIRVVCPQYLVVRRQSRTTPNDTNDADAWPYPSLVF